MKTAHIYEYKGILYLRPYSQTTAGVWVGMDSIVKLDSATPRSEKGRAALAVLNESKNSIPHPTEFGNLDDDSLLQAACATSWASFMREAKCVTLDEKNSRLTLVPQKNMGHKDGYAPILRESVEVPLNSTPQHVGIAVENALSHCQ